MTTSLSPRRIRPELAEFLRQRRESLSPESVGLSAGKRRRTPGLRREEVAALAGVGLTWYTWLEQGRDISVSADFLDNLSRVFGLDATERRHLYVLAQERPPTADGRTFCTVPPLVQRLLSDLPHRLVYLLNLRWDVLAWNTAADRVFRFSAQPEAQRNMLRMLFVLPEMHRLFYKWEEQLPGIVGSFRRDFARAPQDAAIKALVKELEKSAPDFKMLWKRQEMHPCYGVRNLYIDSLGVVPFEHTTLIADEERHLRLVYYAALPDTPEGESFESWVRNP